MEFAVQGQSSRMAPQASTLKKRRLWHLCYIERGSRDVFGVRIHGVRTCMRR
jgi:hypothetical protein